MDEYSVGEYIIYRNGEKYELGRIKSLREDGAFVAYHEGETGALTPYSHMHKLINRYCIKDTTLGGDYFKADTPQMELIVANEQIKEAMEWTCKCANTYRVDIDIHIASGDVSVSVYPTFRDRAEQSDCSWK